MPVENAAKQAAFPASTARQSCPLAGWPVQSTALESKKRCGGTTCRFAD
jgi:hypothetical protein